jgi:hypothetical protein
MLSNASRTSDGRNPSYQLKLVVLFKTEAFLVNSFIDLLDSSSSPWGLVQITREFYYSRGRTDVVALRDENHVIAFEAKLKDWRKALDQAYRNTCFAHSSYVLLPKRAALNAYRFVREFQHRKVGLCYLNGAECVILVEPEVNDPLEPWLAAEAISRALA